MSTSRLLLIFDYADYTEEASLRSEIVMHVLYLYRILMLCVIDLFNEISLAF